jgi:small conductance mechanosensitive channel
MSFLNALAHLPPFALFAVAAESDPSFRQLGRSWHADIVDFVRHDAPKIVVILVMAFVLQRTVAFFVNRMRRIADAYAGHNQRASQLRTMAAILRATCYGLIGFIALLQILPLFNIDLKPLLASAGVVGLGISFGAQSLFKDMLNGVFILLEDQFNVGDVVRLAGLTGTVEDLSLRATTLRDGDGTQHFIPNSQIATVSNLSREFSVASLPVSVDASADPDRVMALLREIAAEVRRDPAFANIAIADPDILGVDKIIGREVLYPVNIRVRANQRDGILRALRRKVLQRFEKEGIPLGTPTSTIVMQGQDPTVAVPTPSITGS